MQIGVSVHTVTDQASCPLGWRLFLPESWDDICSDTNEYAAVIAARRIKAQIPDTVRNRPKWALALETIDELVSWGHRPPLVVADADYGEIGYFRTGLTERNVSYVVQVKAETTVHRADASFAMPAYSGKGRPPTQPSYRTAPIQAKALVHALQPAAFEKVSWRQGTKATMTSRFAATRVRPANRNLPRDPDGSPPECWLLAEWPDDADEPTDYWLSTLPADTPTSELVRLGKIRWHIEHDYRELKTRPRPGPFRRPHLAPGWHHHVTLVTAAHLLTTTQRLNADPKATGAT